MVDANLIKKRIIEILRNRGPTLPIQIARETKIDSLFISAFLSELLNEKKIKTSSLKVGGSSLYFLEGQEEQLEKFYNYLHPKESEAYLLLKNKKVLKDSEQEPAIRVALRAIKDFAVAFKIEEEIYWRYVHAKESEINDILNSIGKKEKPIEKELEKEVEEKEEKPTELREKQKKKIHKTIKEKKIVIEEFKNPLLELAKSQTRKEKPKSDFVLKAIDFINKHFKLIEEKGYGKKEYNCIVEIDTELGPINFLTSVKDKKTISEGDVKKLLLNSQTIPLPALMIYTKEISKKALEYQKKYSSILKIKKMNF